MRWFDGVWQDDPNHEPTAWYEHKVSILPKGTPATGTPFVEIEGGCDGPCTVYYLPDPVFVERRDLAYKRETD
eukprot:30244-Eustigmatos_ZCMA.PRE.1